MCLNDKNVCLRIIILGKTFFITHWQINVAYLKDICHILITFALFLGGTAFVFVFPVTQMPLQLSDWTYLIQV